MESKQKSLMYDLATYFVNEKKYKVLYINIKESEVWLSKEIEKTDNMIRIVNKRLDWKNRLKSDMATVFQRARSMEKSYSHKVINITNIYITDLEPVDDWETLLKPLKLEDKLTYNMSVFYITNDNESTEIKRLNQSIDANFIKHEYDEEDRVKKQKKILVNNVTEQRNEMKQIFSYGKPFFTFLIIAINVILFILLEIRGGSTDVPNLIELGAKYNPAMIDGEWWRAITSMFLHIGALHLFMNMLALYFLGVLIERIFGSTRFLFIYFLSGIGGSMTSFALSSSVSAGASGALFGLFGALLFFGVNYKKLFFKTMGRNVIFILVLNLFIGILIPNIDMGAHVGGLLTGFLASAIVSLPRKKNYKITILSLIAYLVIIGGLSLFGIEASENDPLYLLMQTEESINNEEYEEAIEYATRGLQYESELTPSLLFQRAYANLELNELNKAEEDLEESIKLESHFPEAYYNLAIVHYEKGDMEKAEKYIDKAMGQTSDQDRFQEIYEKIKQSKE